MEFNIYHLNQSILVLGAVGWYFFILVPILIEYYVSKQ